MKQYVQSNVDDKDASKKKNKKKGKKSNPHVGSTVTKRDLGLTENARVVME